MVLIRNGCCVQGFRQCEMIFKKIKRLDAEKHLEKIARKSYYPVLQGKISIIEADRQKKEAKYYLDFRAYTL